ncbi:hypothetical protein N7U66_00350 [Lacinutrix neustonica]|uniref:Uncharacterized protein n=1 Tax=Lacinutrix neustonica TaxID=2980107 RepID=A0A9E8SEF3_9FLAO|nr:hypothetical protein [Lacinutrix neustonica]WAC02269.1 hypothetical protein N7U66_00350 [Lacinutrix neustonica]
MNRIVSIIGFLFITMCLSSCKGNAPKTEAVIQWSFAQQYYLDNMSTAMAYLDSLKQEGMKGKKSKFYFERTREAFKKAEPYASYLNP